MLPIATHSHKKTGFGQRVKVEILTAVSSKYYLDALANPVKKIGLGVWVNNPNLLMAVLSRHYRKVVTHSIRLYFWLISDSK